MDLRLLRIPVILVGGVLYLRYAGFSWTLAVAVIGLAFAGSVLAVLAVELVEDARENRRRNQQTIETAERVAAIRGFPWMQLHYGPIRWRWAARRPWLWPWARIESVSLSDGPSTPDPILRRDGTRLRRDRDPLYS